MCSQFIKNYKLLITALKLMIDLRVYFHFTVLSVLSLTDVTSKFRTVAMFVIVSISIQNFTRLALMIISYCHQTRNQI